jgi:hypothetical protein
MELGMPLENESIFFQILCETLAKYLPSQTTIELHDLNPLAVLMILFETFTADVARLLVYG